MSGAELQLTVLGARGSMAGDRPDCAAFGGDSSCYMIRAGEETVFLDAGSGLLRAPAHYPRPPMILLSHLHLDHLIGLAMFPGLSDRELHLGIYVPFCTDRDSAERLLDRLYSPPFWPIRLRETECRPDLLPMPEKLTKGELSIEAMTGNHPGGCLVFRISYRGRSLVYATDFEHEESSFARLAAFAKGTDLLLYDAQYTDSEYDERKGFGHSTAAKGLELQERCGAGRLLLVHHAPWATDQILQDREAGLPADRAAYARQGQTLSV